VATQKSSLQKQRKSYASAVKNRLSKSKPPKVSKATKFPTNIAELNHAMKENPEFMAFVQMLLDLFRSNAVTTQESPSPTVEHVSESVEINATHAMVVDSSTESSMKASRRNRDSSSIVSTPQEILKKHKTGHLEKRPCDKGCGKHLAPGPMSQHLPQCNGKPQKIQEKEKREALARSKQQASIPTNQPTLTFIPVKAGTLSSQ
jgi:hypothetical protein